MYTSPSEIIEQSVAFVQAQGLSILLPKVFARDGGEFIYGTTFFLYDENEKVKPYDRLVVACDPLGAAIYCSFQQHTKGTLCGSANFIKAAEVLGVDYNWVRGFNAGWFMAISGPYVPRDDFNLRTHFDPDAFDLGMDFFKKLNK